MPLKVGVTSQERLVKWPVARLPRPTLFRCTVLAAWLGLLAVLAPPPILAAGDVFVNTTEDLMYESSLCLPGKDCSLRAAIGRLETRGGNIRACYDPAEVGGAKRCPPGWKPLS